MFVRPRFFRNPQSAIRNPPWAGFLFWSVVFGLIYTQAPLYYSNQNQYFLHGLAWAGRGMLSEDWLANTRDPTPLFSALVAATARLLPDCVFHVYYWLVLGVYFQSMVGLAAIVTGRPDDRRLRGWLITLFLVVHSALFRLLCSQWFGMDYLWFFQAGLAGQYVLGPMLQPSVFGVGLILSIYLFLIDRPWLAVTASSLTAVVHATYLLSAGALTLAYLLLLWRDGQGKKAVAVTCWAVLLVLPGVGYVLTTFAPTSVEQFAEAQAILVHVRVPHHAVPALWFDRFTVAQVAWVLIALYLVRGTRLYVILVISLFFGVGLTLLQLATGSDSLALLFPWRLSVYLVPIATTIGLARLAAWLAPLLSESQRVMRWVQVAVVSALFLSGIYVTWTGLGFRISTDEVPMMEFVRAHKAPGDVYLIPAELPAGPGSNGSPMSVHFNKRSNNGLIPIELQKFRLDTGAPIFVDFKSIPYHDVEVLEWYRRLRWNQRFYEQVASSRVADFQPELTKYGVTHIVSRAGQEVSGDRLELIYRDDYFRIDRVPRARAR